MKIELINRLKKKKLMLNQPAFWLYQVLITFNIIAFS